MNRYLSLLVLSLLFSTPPLMADDSAGSQGQFSASLRGSDVNDTLQGELMAEGAINEAMTGRVGVSFFISEDTGIYGGIEGGIRSEMKSRIAPFVGAGLMLGSWTEYELAESDGIDNDGDGSVDEAGEEEEVTDYLGAIYPEIGLHLWLTESLRITASTRYYITSKGRGSDRRLSGIGLALRF